MRLATAAVTEPNENQRKEEEEVEEGREDKRPKEAQAVKRHPWAKQGKQETKTTWGRLLGDTRHPVPSATFPASSLSSSKPPNPWRAISPSWPSSHIRPSDLSASERRKRKESLAFRNRTQPFLEWKAPWRWWLTLSRFQFPGRRAPLPQGRADMSDKNCLAQCYI